MTTTNYLAELVREEQSELDYLLRDAQEDLRQQRASIEVYAYHHNGHTEGVY